MRERIHKASDIYVNNLKLYNRLSNTKSTIPTIEVLKKKEQKNSVLKQRLSEFDVVRVKHQK